MGRYAKTIAKTNAKTLYVVTAFIGKSGYKNKMEAPQLANAKNLGATSEIESVVTSTISIQQSAQDVKKKNMHKSRTPVSAPYASPTAQEVIDAENAYLEAKKDRATTKVRSKVRGIASDGKKFIESNFAKL